MSVDVVFGGFALVFGASTLVLRQTHPHLFSKLKPMKEQFGDTGGWIVHFIGYTVVPLAVGAVMLMKGLQGR